jgi:ankyrin repeat protein
MMLKRLMTILVSVGLYMHASEIAHIDKTQQELLTRHLFRAIIMQYPFEEINNLIAQGADVNAKDVIGATPCHHAAVLNEGRQIKILCENYAFVNIKDDDGNTPLHYACRHGSSDAVKILLEFGADRWEKNDSGLIPVECAQKFGRNNIVEFIENYQDVLEIKEPEVG